MPLADLQTLRGRIFFWIGLLILPVFWLWWMTDKHFSKIQISGARVWAVVYLGVVIIMHEQLAPYLPKALCDYQFIAIRLTGALTIWLLFRMFGVIHAIAIAIVLCDALAVLLSELANSLNGPLPGIWIVLFPLFPAALHLLLEPWQGRGNKSTNPHPSPRPVKRY